MDTRIKLVFIAMVNALLGKVEDPQMMLEQTYAELQSTLISTRADLRRLLALQMKLISQIEELRLSEAQVKRQIVGDQMSNSELSKLEKKLKEVQDEIAKLLSNLADLKNEFQKAYTKKQVLIARDKAGQATLHATDAILVGKAITEDGLTYDHELYHGSERAPKEDVPTWLIKLMVAIVVAMVIGTIIALIFLAWWRAVHS